MTSPLLLALLLGFSLLTPATAQPVGSQEGSPTLAYRSMAFTNPEDATPKMLRLGAEMGFNDLCVQTEHGDQAGDIRKARESFVEQGMLELCDELGMTISLWVHEFMDYDESWGPRELDNEVLWEALAKRYDEYLTELFPEIDYLVLTTTETQHRIAPGDPLLAKVVNVLNAACERHGKRLIYRNFRHGPDWLKEDRWPEFLEAVPQSVIMQSKTVVQDFHMRGLLHPLIGVASEKGFEEIVEFDGGGEYFRRNELANVWTEELERRLREHLAEGITGISVRVDRRGRNSFDHPNIANAYYLARAVNGEGLDHKAALRAFVEEYYGADLVEDLVPILDSTGKVNAEALCIGRDTFGNGRDSGITGMHGAGIEDVTFWPWQPKRWLKAYDPDNPLIAENEAVLRGDPAMIAREQERYAEALQLAETALQDVEKLQSRMEPEAYDLLHWLLVENRFHLVAMQEWQMAWLKLKRAQNVEETGEKQEMVKQAREHIDKVRAMIPQRGEKFTTAWRGTERTFQRGRYMDMEEVCAKLEQMAAEIE